MGGIGFGYPTPNINPAATKLRAVARRLAKAGEPVQGAHEGVTADVRRRSLRRLGNSIRRRAHEPRQEDLVLRMVVPVRALRAVRVRPLQVGIRSYRETDPGHRITSLKEVAAAARLCRRCPPRLYEVVDERVIRPLGNLVAKGVNVLKRPIRPSPPRRKRPSEEARRRVRAPGEGLHRLIAVAVLRPIIVMRRYWPGTVEADHAAVERIRADEIHGVLRQV